MKKKNSQKQKPAKWHKYLWIFNGVFGLVLLIYITYNLFFPTFASLVPGLFVEDSNSQIRYVALGDSYTIGEGAGKQNSWPNQLVQKLKKDGVDIELVSNPSRTGFTTSDLIQYELPVLYESNARFVSVMIGVNDWVRGVPQSEFRENLEFILDEAISQVGSENIVVVTIPDFSKTPNGNFYSFGRNIENGIFNFNEIIKIEAQKRNLLLVDIFYLSKEIVEDETNIASDGLHYSREGYHSFMEKIYAESRVMFE